MISYREKDFMYSYNEMSPKPFSTHLHKYYEILYFVQGDATYIVEGAEYKAEDGDLFVTRPGELHSIAFKSDRRYERHFIQISEEYLAFADVDLLEKLRNKPLGENNRLAQRIERDEIDRLFKKVGYYVENKAPESDIVIKSCVVQLLAAINTALGRTPENVKPENERVAAAKEYINKNLCGNLSLCAIAEASYTDKYYLSHLFRRETGMAVKDYINMQRIALAKKLISEGAGAAEVYSDCGFNDYSSFYRAFRRLCGKSPSEFFKVEK